MKFKVEDVMKFVRKALGRNAKELLIYREAVDDCGEPSDYDIYLDRNCTIFLDDWGGDCEVDDYRIENGCSKLVIIPKNRSYVIKLPWTGVYTDCDEDGEYNGAFVFDYELNYSAMEEEISYYNDMDEDTRQYLAENEFVGFYNNSIPVYIQEKVVNLGYGAKTNTSVTRQFTEKAPIYRLGAKVAKMIVEQIGYSEGLRVVRELEYIDDLHNANYGFDKYGQFKIIDYAGFYIENYFAYNN